MKTCFYKLEKVVVNQLNPNSIPYIYYCVLSGPMGGRVLCDLYNTERLFNIYNTANGTYSYLATENTILRYANEKGIVVVNHPDRDKILKENTDEYKCILPEDKGIRIKLIRNKKCAKFDNVAKLFKL